MADPMDLTAADEAVADDDQDQAYRATMEERYAEASASYDKTLVTLAGGALAVSFAFVKDIAPSPVAESLPLLFGAWVCFGLSLGLILTALLSSQRAIRKAMDQVDDSTVHDEKPGGVFSTITQSLNILTAILFVAGVISLSVFGIWNLSEEIEHGRKEINWRSSAASATGEAETQAGPRQPRAASREAREPQGVRTPEAAEASEAERL